MGQYHYVANIDMREYLHPHVMGDGLKLMEFGPSGGGTMLGLALLLACSNGRGGGDFGCGSVSGKVWRPGRARVVVADELATSAPCEHTAHARSRGIARAAGERGPVSLRARGRDGCGDAVAGRARARA